jgi:hypothetical protein
MGRKHKTAEKASSYEEVMTGACHAPMPVTYEPLMNFITSPALFGKGEYN